MFMVAARFCIALLGIILSLFLARSRIKITTGAIVGYFLLRVLGMAVLIFIFNIPARLGCLSLLIAFC